MTAVIRFLQDRKTTWCFFAVVLVLGLGIAMQYGVSWDEKAMYVLGEEAFETITKGEPYPVHEGIRYHGALFEVVQYAVPELLGITYARPVFMLRHALNFLTFFAALLAIYAIALRAFQNRAWALLAAVFLLLSPRQFGHAFFNSRDIPTMAAFTVQMLTLMLLLDRRTLWCAMLAGITTGIVLALRVGGLFLPLYTVLFLGLEAVRMHLERERIAWKHFGKILAAYAFAAIIATIALWPLLWDQPLQNFIAAIGNMLTSQQQPGGFYFGEHIGYVPWHWVPVHILIQTPLLYSALFLAGVVILVRRAIQSPRSLLEEHRTVFLFLLWFLIPVGMVIVLGADLFDEWRHLYFIYPAFLLLAVFGLREIVLSLVTRPSSLVISVAVTTLLVLASTISTGIWMIRNHPLQYVYFSIPSQWVDGNFELDYWGLSYRQGFEWILANDPDDFIPIHVTSSPGWENLNILTTEQRQRIFLTNRETLPSKYVLDNFRWQHYKKILPEETKVHAVTVSGIEVLGIYRNPAWEAWPESAQKRMEDTELQFWFDPNNMM